MSVRDFTLYRHLLNPLEWQNDGSLPPHIAKWLRYSHSLTEKLQTICDCVQVEVINEGWQAENWVREVVLKCGENDWIFAQTVLPKATIENVGQAVLELGDKAIGLWLFPQNPERISLEWRKENGLYARRSELHLKGYPIEIKELFLTNFPFDDETNHSAL